MATKEIVEPENVEVTITDQKNLIVEFDSPAVPALRLDMESGKQLGSVIASQADQIRHNFDEVGDER